jgi:hypothetical protein
MEEKTTGGMADSMSSEGLSSWHVVEGSETISIPNDNGVNETVVVAPSASYDESASSVASSSHDGSLKSIKAQKWKERLAKKGKKEEDGDADGAMVDKDDDAREPTTQPSKAQKWKDRLAKKNKQKHQEEEKEEALTNTMSAAEAAKLVLESSSFSELTAKKRAEEAAKRAAKEQAEREKLEEEKERLAIQEEQAKQIAVAMEQQTQLQDVVHEQLASNLPAEQENVASEAVVPDVEIIEENDLEHIKEKEGMNTVDFVPSKSDLTMDDDDEGNGESLIVLLSGSDAQRSSQDVMWTKLKGRGVVFEEVNGCEPEDLAALRDELVAISGVQGAYPQFFVKDGDRITYWKDCEALEKMNADGELLETFAGSIQVLVVQNPPSDESSAVPRQAAARSVSFGHTTIDTWRDEYPIPPKPQNLSSRTVSTDSALIPDETFENEFDDPSEILRSRSMSRDSTAIPEESFENEFNEENVVSISRETSVALDESFENEDDQDDGLHLEDNTNMPSETFENEYVESTSLAVSATTQDDGVALSSKVAPVASQATSSVVPDEHIEDDNDAKKAEERFTQDSSSNSFLHLHIALGALAVAAVAGMWLSGRSQRGK